MIDGCWECGWGLQLCGEHQGEAGRIECVEGAVRCGEFLEGTSRSVYKEETGSEGRLGGSIAALHFASVMYDVGWQETRWRFCS